MNAILPGNPIPPPLTATQISEASSLPHPIAPAAGPATAGDAGDATGFAGSGTGSGTSKQAENAALFSRQPATAAARPAEPTGRSVIDAQAQTLGSPANLPEVPMPDPLPTSPFLKGSGSAA